MKALEWLKVVFWAGAEIASMVRESRKKGDTRDVAVVIADMEAKRRAGHARREEADRKARERIGRRS